MALFVAAHPAKLAAFSLLSTPLLATSKVPPAAQDAATAEPEVAAEVTVMRTLRPRRHFYGQLHDRPQGPLTRRRGLQLPRPAAAAPRVGEVAARMAADALHQQLEGARQQAVDAWLGRLADGMHPKETGGAAPTQVRAGPALWQAQSLLALAHEALACSPHDASLAASVAHGHAMQALLLLIPQAPPAPALPWMCALARALAFCPDLPARSVACLAARRLPLLAQQMAALETGADALSAASASARRVNATFVAAEVALVAQDPALWRALLAGPEGEALRQQVRRGGVDTFAPWLLMTGQLEQLFLLLQEQAGATQAVVRWLYQWDQAQRAGHHVPMSAAVQAEVLHNAELLEQGAPLQCRPLGLMAQLNGIFAQWAARRLVEGVVA